MNRKKTAALITATVLSMSTAGVAAAQERPAEPVRPNAEIVWPLSDIPAIVAPGSVVEVSFEADVPLKYDIDHSVAGADEWLDFADGTGEGRASRGINTVEVLLPGGTTTGDYDLRIQLITPGKPHVLAEDIVESAVRVRDLPTTAFEDSDSTEWTAHEEELAFLDEVAAASDRIGYSEIAQTTQGRPLNLVRIGFPEPPRDPEIAAGNSVLVVAEQHGNEPAAREMALQLVRDLAFTHDRELVEQLADATVLVIPTANPDGRAANTANNSDRIDVNRDHLKFASPEGEAIGSVLRTFTPDISVDAHERGPRATNPNIEMQWPRNLNVDEPLRAINAEMVQDYVRQGIEDAGFSTGEFATTTAGDERILRNVFGLRHGLGMLIETMWEDAPEFRVDMQLRAVDEVLRFQRERGDEVSEVVSGARFRKADAGADQSAPFFLAGADGQDLPPGDAVLDPPPCGYLLHTSQADAVEDQIDLFALHTEHVSEHGVFVSMGQPAMTVTPLLLDERASFSRVNGIPLDDCSDPGTIEPSPVAVSASATPRLLFRGKTTELEATLFNRSSELVTANALVDVPDGWTVEPAQTPYELEPGAETTITFSVTAAADAESPAEYAITVKSTNEDPAGGTADVWVRDGVVYAVDGEPWYTETGPWSQSSLESHASTSSRYAHGGTGAVATWTPELESAGTYNVYAWYPTNVETTTEAEFTVNHAAGSTELIVNQRDTGDRWNLLGTWEFVEGNAGTVTLESVATGFHRAGAVWFERVDQE